MNPAPRSGSGILLVMPRCQPIFFGPVTVYQVEKLIQWMVFSHGVVLGEGHAVEFMELNPPFWFEVS